MLDRLRARVVVDEAGCWQWVGAKGFNGYGKMKHGGRSCYTHRLAFEAANGPIPDGLTIDHLCRNRSCCNPAHLEAVTLSENVRRSPRAHKSHCSAGHELSPGNLYVDPKGYRKCRECKRGYKRAGKSVPPMNLKNRATNPRQRMIALTNAKGSSHG